MICGLDCSQNSSDHLSCSQNTSDRPDQLNCSQNRSYQLSFSSASAQITGDFEVELLHGEEHIEVLFEDLFDRNIVDVDLRLSDQKDQKVEGALKDLKFDAMIRFSIHGVEI